MAAEAATKIHELNSGAPTGAEPLSEADDHLRVIKTSVQGSFPAFGVDTDSGVVTLGADEINAIPADIDSAVAGGTTADILVDALFPIGAIYLTIGNTNPGTLLGHGTWGQIAQGRFLGGVGTGTDSTTEERTFAAGDTGGTYSHALTEAELAAHTHNIYARDDAGNSERVEGFQVGDTSVGGETGGSHSYLNQNVDGVQIVQDTGSGTAHENTPPAFGVYVWQRTA